MRDVTVIMGTEFEGWELIVVGVAFCVIAGFLLSILSDVISVIGKIVKAIKDVIRIATMRDYRSDRKDMTKESIIIGFRQFMQCYDLNPDRYELDACRVRVYSADSRHLDIICTIHFSVISYWKYCIWKWEMKTSKERHIKLVNRQRYTSAFLESVQSDIDKCRSEYIKAAETATKIISKMEENNNV